MNELEFIIIINLVIFIKNEYIYTRIGYQYKENAKFFFFYDFPFISSIGHRLFLYLYIHWAQLSLTNNYFQFAQNILLDEQ